MFKAIPIDMISAPNFSAPLKDGWSITSSNAQVLWFELSIVDGLGQRSYTAAVGSSLAVTFQRADIISMNQQGNILNTIQDVVKTATFNNLNRSLLSIALTASDVQRSLSGTVKFTLTESGTVTDWVQNWILTKKLTVPGY